MFFKEIYKHTRWYPYFSMQNRPLECKGVDAWLPIRLIRTNIGNIHFPDNMVRLWDTPLIYTPQFENRSAVEVRSRPTSLQSLDKKGLTGSITGHIVGRAALVFAILRFIGMQTFSLYLVQKFFDTIFCLTLRNNEFQPKMHYQYTITYNLKCSNRYKTRERSGFEITKKSCTSSCTKKILVHDILG